MGPEHGFSISLLCLLWPRSECFVCPVGPEQGGPAPKEKGSPIICLLARKGQEALGGVVVRWENCFLERQRATRLSHENAHFQQFPWEEFTLEKKSDKCTKMQYKDVHPCIV